MSEQEINLTGKLLKSIRKAQRMMVERKAALGQTVVIADADGKPREIPAKDALGLYPKP